MRLSIIILFLFTYSVTTGQHTLQLNLLKGEEYGQITTSKITVDQEFGGQKMTIVITVKGGMSYKVKEITKTGYLMDVMYKELSINMKLPQGEMGFSSEKNDVNDIMSQVLAAMRNKPFEVAMSKFGKVEAVKNIDVLFETVFDQFPQIPKEQVPQLKAQLMESYGEKSFRGSLEMVTAIFTDKKVEKGDKWVVETDLQSNFTAKVTSTYEYLGEENNLRKIKGDSNIKTDASTTSVASNGMTTRFDLKGTMNSEIAIDPVTGWIVEATVSQNISGNTIIGDDPSSAMQVPMVMKSDMIIRSK